MKVTIEVKGLESILSGLAREDILESFREEKELLRDKARQEAVHFGERWTPLEERVLIDSFLQWLEQTCKRHGRTLASITSRYRKLRAEGWEPWIA